MRLNTARCPENRGLPRRGSIPSLLRPGLAMAASRPEMEAYKQLRVVEKSYSISTPREIDPWHRPKRVALLALELATPGR